MNINLDLYWLCSFLILFIQKNDRDRVELCLQHGADPNLGMFAQRWSPLATAAQYDASLEIVELLLGAGGKVEGSDVLQTAAENGRLGLMKLLVVRCIMLSMLAMRIR